MATKFNASSTPATAPSPPNQGRYPHKFGSPLQAPIHSAWLGGTLEGPPVVTDTSQVRKNINGMAQLAAALTMQWSDFVSPGRPWLGPGGIILINPFASLIAAFQGMWDLYSTVADTYTDNTGGGGGFSNTSSISGGGDCPAVSSPPNWWYPWRSATGIPGDWISNISNPDGSHMSDPSGNWSFDRVQTGPLDLAGQFIAARSVLDTLAYNSSATFDQPFAKANFDITGLDPNSFTGNPLPSGAGAAFPHVGSAFSGWSLTTSVSGGGQTVLLQKQRATLPVGNRRQPFFVARYQEGLRTGFLGFSQPTDVQSRITFVENGFINPGESIGSGGSTIDLPLVSMPTTGGTLGTAPMITEGYFAVVGKTPAQWSKDLSLKFGDNF